MTPYERWNAEASEITSAFVKGDGSAYAILDRIARTVAERQREADAKEARAYANKCSSENDDIAASVVDVVVRRIRSAPLVVDGTEVGR